MIRDGFGFESKRRGRSPSLSSVRMDGPRTLHRIAAMNRWLGDVALLGFVLPYLM